jgi:hypothetical protein
MRRFTIGSVTDRKIVLIELDGPRMSVVQMKADGSTKRTEKDLGSEAAARESSEQMARELISRGYVEQIARGKPPKQVAAAPKPAARAGVLEEVDPYDLLDDVEPPAATAAPVLPRLDVAPIVKPAAESEPKKKKAGGRKKKKKAESGDALDKRVLAGIGAVGVLLIGCVGFIIYDVFLKPPTIVGTWRGSLLEHEIGRLLRYTRYDLILDEQKRASLTLQEKFTWVGTYSLRGNRLKLTLKDKEGDSNDREYKISLGRATLDLHDPESGELAVQLIRFLEKPVVGGNAPPPLPPPD